MKFHHRWAGAALAVVALGTSALAHAASVSGQGTWETTLQGRDLDGNTSSVEAYYDTSLNITWLANANYAGTTMMWANANAWAAGLNFNGITGWRLPTVTDTGTPGCNFAYTGTDCGWNVNTGEMAHLFYDALGNKGMRDSSGMLQVGGGLTNTGPFSNIQDAYRYGTVFAPYYNDTFSAGYADYMWDFNFYLGEQGFSSMSQLYYAWAVHSGDVGVAATASTVPVPSAVWLFGSGLLGLIGMARRKQPK